MNTFDLLPVAEHDGPTNMAVDEVMLASAVAGSASLRFYTWSTATLSLGYFQREADRHTDPLLKPLPYVRRASGGAALVHHLELTYALALPEGPTWQPRARPWLDRMHGIIAGALAAFGALATVCRKEQRRSDVLCFLHHTPGDLILDGHKIVGSAQRKQRGALLQHGAILLAQSPHTPGLPGLRELTGIAISAQAVQAIVQSAFLADTGWQVEERDWTATERARVQELVHEKYASDTWNLKR